MNAPELIARLLRGEPETRFDLTGLGHPYHEMVNRMLNANGEGRLGALADALDVMPDDEGKLHWEAIIVASDLLEADHE
jgi:hypothetical protein